MRQLALTLMALGALALGACQPKTEEAEAPAATVPAEAPAAAAPTATTSGAPTGGTCGTIAGIICASTADFCKTGMDQCGVADAQGVCTTKPQVCTEQYDPVCGCDGTTYGNACDADRAGVNVQAKGACKPA